MLVILSQASEENEEAGERCETVIMLNGTHTMRGEQAQFSTTIGPGPARLCSHWLIGIIVLLRQLSYAIKTQLKGA